MEYNRNIDSVFIFPIVFTIGSFCINFGVENVILFTELCVFIGIQLRKNYSCL